MVKHVRATRPDGWARLDDDGTEEWDDIAARHAGRSATRTGRSVSCSGHALSRGARRNVVPDAIDYVLAHGRRMQRTGVVFCFLGRRDVPEADRADSWMARLVGTVVMLSQDGVIITVYRNQHAWKAIRHKLKYHMAECSRRHRHDHRCDEQWDAPTLMIA